MSLTPRAFAYSAASAALLAGYALLLIAGATLQQAGGGAIVAMLVVYAVAYAFHRRRIGVELGEPCEPEAIETPVQTLIAIASLAAFAVCALSATA